MSVRNILTIGHPRLRVPALSVSIEDISSSRVQNTITDLVETMRAVNGAGLAANQIGGSQRIVVLEVNHNPRYPYKPTIPLTVAVNPLIEPLDNETLLNNEGCLSVPLRGDVERFANVRVSYFDAHGQQHCDKAHGLTAATWQHEVDHLDGILFIDRVEPRSLATWEEFALHHQQAFLERISKYVRQ